MMTSREHEAGQITIGHDVSPALIVPPDTTNFITAGHCSSECTQKQFPQEGIKVFNALMHSHLAGAYFTECKN